MFCGVWSYSRGNPCGGLANILQLFPETLLPLRQSFTATGGQVSRFSGFKFIFNKKAFSSHQNLLYWCYKNTPKMFWKKENTNVWNSEMMGRNFSAFFTVRWHTEFLPFLSANCVLYIWSSEEKMTTFENLSFLLLSLTPFCVCSSIKSLLSTNIGVGEEE